jgi:hypothetical protein
VHHGSGDAHSHAASHAHGHESAIGKFLWGFASPRVWFSVLLGMMKKIRVPPLAVGIGIYLPMSATFAVVIGALLAHWYDGRARLSSQPARAERLGTLVASGLIVGESLWGVVNAGLIVALTKDAPIGLVGADFAPAPWLGLLAFVGCIVGLYGWMLRRMRA